MYNVLANSSSVLAMKSGNQNETTYEDKDRMDGVHETHSKKVCLTTEQMKTL
jgi:hypothetical protein